VMACSMNYSAVIGLNIIIDNKEAILMASAKCNRSLVANIELVLVIASLIDIKCLVVRDI
jgi:hypothetical protein